MLDKLYITPRQWLRILRWTLYAALFLLALLVQTVVFGNRTILGAHPDLVAIVITCVCLRGARSAAARSPLIASLVWCLSGIDQGSVCLLVLTVLPVLGSIPMPRRAGKPLPAVAARLLCHACRGAGPHPSDEALLRGRRVGAGRARPALPARDAPGAACGPRPRQMHRKNRRVP